MAAPVKAIAFKTPKEITDAIMVVGVAKSKLSWDKILVLGFLAGVYIAFGGALSQMVAGGYYANSTYQGHPGIQKLLAGSVFPVGLMLVVIAGAELFTGNLACLIPGILTKKVTYRDWMKNWFWSYLGNFIGSVFVAYFLIYLPDVFSLDPWNTYVKNVALKKIELGWGVNVLRAVGCNWLVCLAVWLSAGAHDIGGKILAIWFPIMAFVTLGFEHVIANMYFVPLGLMYGVDKTFWEYIGLSLIPSTIGNIIGGSLMVGGIYFYIYVLDDHLAEEKKKEQAKKENELTSVTPVPAVPASVPIVVAAVAPSEPAAVVEEGKKPVVEEKRAPAS
jgi:formate/nitrite transporter